MAAPRTDPQLLVDAAALEMYLELKRDGARSEPQPDADPDPAPASAD